ncbi:hypothetical protein MBAV_003309, partial [Candidatus Magnetobacterium bavaricum]
MTYMKRKDLTPEIRIRILLQAMMMKGTYGAITNLSKAYKVSRTFTYQLLLTSELLLHLYLIKPSTTKINIELDKKILLLRLEGKCSIQSTMNILKEFGFGNFSEGYISERLKYYGKKISNTLKGEEI